MYTLSSPNPTCGIDHIEFVVVVVCVVIGLTENSLREEKLTSKRESLIGKMGIFCTNVMVIFHDNHKKDEILNGIIVLL